MSQNTKDRQDFERTARALEAEIPNAGVHLLRDASIRQAYARQVHQVAEELRKAALNGRITWAQAAGEAQAARNAVMEIMRGRSTPVGRAIAEYLKLHGKTLNELIARNTLKRFGANADFSRLSSSQRNLVYASIVSSAGTANTTFTAWMGRMQHCGRALLMLSLAMSIYTVANADDKWAASKTEAAYTGAGIGGGIAGGALAGIGCGPAAPVCVTFGAFVGGALAALGVGFVL